jgi:predicted PurR-regulated permease PerM
MVMNQRPVRVDSASSAPRGEQVNAPAASRYVWDGMARGAVVGMFILLLFAALYWTQPVVLPAVLALVVGMVLTPLLIQAEKFGIPHWATAFVLVLSILAGLSYALVLLAEPIAEWIQKAPELGSVLREKLRFLDTPIAAFNNLRESLTGKSAAEQGGPDIDPIAMLVQPVLGVLTPALGQSVIFFATLLFFLSGREAIRIRFLKFWGGRKARLGALQFLKDIESSLAGYFAVIAVINLVLGVLLGAVTWAVGLPSPLVWGVLGFLLNFLPYIGPAVTIVMLLAVGLMAFDSLLHAFIAPAFYLAASILEGELITPSIIGMRLALSPLLVFLAVAFWTWFWGPFGALLAVPLLIIGTVALGYIYPNDEVKLPD